MRSDVDTVESIVGREEVEKLSSDIIPAAIS